MSQSPASSATAVPQQFLPAKTWNTLREIYRAALVFANAQQDVYKARREIEASGDKDAKAERTAVMDCAPHFIALAKCLRTSAPAKAQFVKTESSLPSDAPALELGGYADRLFRTPDVGVVRVPRAHVIGQLEVAEQFADTLAYFSAAAAMNGLMRGPASEEVKIYAGPRLGLVIRQITPVVGAYLHLLEHDKELKAMRDEARVSLYEKQHEEPPAFVASQYPSTPHL